MTKSTKNIVGELSDLQFFTDREDFQEAFERKLNAVAQDKNVNPDGKVLVYYGACGIGKTALKNKLCRIIEHDPRYKEILHYSLNAMHATYDFSETGIASSEIEILTRLRNQIKNQDSTFKFDLFDTALAIYKKKKGIVEPVNIGTTHSLVNNVDALASLVCSIASGNLALFVTLANFSVGILEYVINAHKGKKEKKLFKDTLTELRFLDYSEIENILPKYFYLDMQSNMSYAKVPLVIFLDSYEKYFDANSRDEESEKKDVWIRKAQNSLIKNIPGVLWVILSNERLTWQEDDVRYWRSDIQDRPFEKLSEEEKEHLAKGKLEQHCLGNLSENDTRRYFNKIGITDEPLIANLYMLTDGIPMYLDICREQYQVLNKEKGISLSDFGNEKEELITRYIENMHSFYRELSYFLALLGNWTDEMVFDIQQNYFSLKGFKQERYEEYLKHSFIIKKEDNSYYLQATIKEAFLANIGQAFREEVAKSLDAYYLKELKNNEKTLKYASILEKYLENKLSGKLSIDEIESIWNETHDNLSILYEHVQYRDFSILIHMFYNKLKDCDDKKTAVINKIITIDYAYSLLLTGEYSSSYSKLKEVDLNYFLENVEEEQSKNILDVVLRICNACGKYKEAADLGDKICQLINNSSDNSISDVILEQLAHSNYYLGDYQKAAILEERILDIRKTTLGEEHPKTLTSINSLAEFYSALGGVNEALSLHKENYELRKKVLGEKHPDTISSLNNLANSYSAVGNYEEAFRCSEVVYNLRKEIFGEKHPDTISSLNNLAISYSEVGNYEKSLELSKEGYELSREVLGEEHPKTILSLYNLANVFFKTGRYEEAAKFSREAYKISKEAFGENNPKTLKIFDQYMRICKMEDIASPES